LSREAAGFRQALQDADAGRLIVHARAYGKLMGTLGERAGAAIVTNELDALSRIAEDHGAAAKPSGAGGGDLAVAFTQGPDQTSRLRDAFRREGFHLMSLGAPAPGLRLETSP